VWPRKSNKKAAAAKTEPAAKVKPAKAAKKAKAAAPAKPRQPSPGADVYTVFLAIALVAVLVAILFLCLEMSPYEFKFNGGPPAARLGAPGTGDSGRHAYFATCRVRETHQATSLAVRCTHPTI
jgi:hypothetical protein